MNKLATIKTIGSIAGFSLATSTGHAISLLVTDFQATISSEVSPESTAEGRYYHVSVNPNNAGTGAFAATVPGTETPDTDFFRYYTEDVLSYKFVGGTINDINSIAAQGGDLSLISYTTEDTSFDSFGQSQAKIWTTTDPGADIAISQGLSATADVSGVGYRGLGGAIGTYDISGLATGSVHFYYGAFATTPSVTAVMRDTDGSGGDILLSGGDAHLNGAVADRAEYYLAELDFVNDAGYDEIVVTWLANGTDFTGNGRGVGSVLTGTAVPESSTALLLSFVALGLLCRRR